MLSELDLQEKLITIIVRVIMPVIMRPRFPNYFIVYETTFEKNMLQFHGLDSYVRYIAHILDLIVKDILRALKIAQIRYYKRSRCCL